MGGSTQLAPSNWHRARQLLLHKSCKDEWMVWAPVVVVAIMIAVTLQGCLCIDEDASTECAADGSPGSCSAGCLFRKIYLFVEIGVFVVGFILLMINIIFKDLQRSKYNGPGKRCGRAMNFAGFFGLLAMLFNFAQAWNDCNWFGIIFTVIGHVIGWVASVNSFREEHPANEMALIFQLFDSTGAIVFALQAILYAQVFAPCDNSDDTWSKGHEICMIMAGIIGMGIGYTRSYMTTWNVPFEGEQITDQEATLQERIN